MYGILATIKYDFVTASWIAAFEERPEIAGSGTTPEEAVENLRFQANKHDLYPQPTY